MGTGTAAIPAGRRASRQEAFSFPGFQVWKGRRKITDQTGDARSSRGRSGPDPGARAVPIYQTTSYVFDDTQHAADLFALKVRAHLQELGNPTNAVLEQR